jgi:hypothetical protein
MTYACPTWEFAPDAHLMKLERLQNKVLRTAGKFPRNAPIRDMYIKELRGLSPQANYTDRATTACQRS